MGKKNHRHHLRERALIVEGGLRERERDKATLQGLCKKNTCKELFTEKKSKLLIIPTFYKQQSWKSEVLEVGAIFWVEPGGHSRSPIMKESRGPGGADRVLCGSPGSRSERQSGSESTTGRCGTASKGTKGPVGTTELLNSLAFEQRQLLRAANLDDSFLLYLEKKKKAPVQLCDWFSGTN